MRMKSKYERVLLTRVRPWNSAFFARRLMVAGLVSLAAVGMGGCWPWDEECPKGLCPPPHTKKTCEIDSQFYREGQVNPANHCLVCKPEVSAVSWSNVPAGSACATDRVCSSTGMCLVADGQACATAADCASGVCSKLYPDEDGDGQGKNVLVLLCGATAPAGYSDQYGDCCDTDPQTYTGQTAYFPVPNACGSFDYNCDLQAYPHLEAGCTRCSGGAPPTCAGTVISGWCPEVIQKVTPAGTLCTLPISACEDAIRCGVTMPYIVSGGGEGACAEFPAYGCEVVLEKAVVESRTVHCR